MPPNIDTKMENPKYDENEFQPKLLTKASPRKYEIVWINVIMFTIYHICGSYGLYVLCMEAKWMTILYACLNYYICVLGVGAGVHRLWSHKAYKATTGLQIFLMVAHSMANQHTIAHWVRDHRLHHKFSDTDADPHNATRGFFYSHVGWILVKKHPEAKRRQTSIDMSDIYSNPVVMFQKRHQHWFIITMAFIIPTFIPLLWGEALLSAFFVNKFRYILLLNATFLVNSAAHIWGEKPYDKNISPSQNNFAALATFGEGYHNYHHVFPFDYRAGEFGVTFNYTTFFIDFCARFGLAFDRKFASVDMVRERRWRTGEGNK